MKRLVGLTALFVLIAAASPGPALAGGNANFVLGQRMMADDDFWEPTDTMGAFGATVDFGREAWPISLAIGFYMAAAEEDVNLGGGFRGDITAAIAEFSFGVRKTWKIETFRPYVGGGLSSVGAAVELDVSGIGDVDEDDQSVGVYVEGGTYWRLGSRFNIGLDLRYTFGTDVTFDFGGGFVADGDADSIQFGLILGWGWPATR